MHRDLVVALVTRETEDNQASLAHVVTLASLELQVLWVCPDLLDSQVPLVLLEMLDHGESLEHRDLQVFRETPDLLVHLASKELLVQLVQKELLAYKVLLDNLEYKVACVYCYGNQSNRALVMV